MWRSALARHLESRSARAPVIAARTSGRVLQLAFAPRPTALHRDRGQRGRLARGRARARRRRGAAGSPQRPARSRSRGRVARRRRGGRRRRRGGADWRDDHRRAESGPGGARGRGGTPRGHLAVRRPPHLGGARPRLACVAGRRNGRRGDDYRGTPFTTCRSRSSPAQMERRLITRTNVVRLIKLSRMQLKVRRAWTPVRPMQDAIVLGEPRQAVLSLLRLWRARHGARLPDGTRRAALPGRGGRTASRLGLEVTPGRRPRPARAAGRWPAAGAHTGPRSSITMRSARHRARECLTNHDITSENCMKLQLAVHRFLDTVLKRFGGGPRTRCARSPMRLVIEEHHGEGRRAEPLHEPGDLPIRDPRRPGSLPWQGLHHRPGSARC